MELDNLQAYLENLIRRRYCDYIVRAHVSINHSGSNAAYQIRIIWTDILGQPYVNNSLLGYEADTKPEIVNSLIDHILDEMDELTEKVRDVKRFQNNIKELLDE